MSKRKDHSWVGLLIGVVGLIAILTVLYCETKAQVSLSTQADLKFDTDSSTAKILNRDVRCRIGDSKELNFKPELEITAWNGDCSFMVNLTNPTDMVNSSLLSVENLFQKVTFTTVQGDSTKIYVREDGCMEWEIVIPDKPKSNRFTYEIESRGFSFLYQDPLLIPNQHDSIQGSYAVYHSSKKNNIRYINGKDTTYENYGIGKAFHIYRPRAWDSDGDTAWCDLIIEDSLTVVVPQSFLDEAVYPVTVDPTFGYTSAGASEFTMGDQNIFFNYKPSDTADFDGSIDSCNAYTQKNAAIDDDSCMMALYTYDDDKANCDSVSISEAFLETGLNKGGPEWAGAAFEGGDSVEAGEGYIVGISGKQDGSSHEILYDADGAYKLAYENYASDWAWPGDLTGYNQTIGERFSMYVSITYVAAEAAVSTRRRKMLLK